MSVIPSPATTSTRLRVESTKLSGNAVRVAVTGDIDLACSDELRACLIDAIGTGPARRLEIDLAGVTFLDCRGLSVLVGVRQAAAHAGCRLRITGPPPGVRRILAITGLLGLLTSDPIE